MSIHIENLSFAYGKKEIFNDFSKDFDKGVFYSLSAVSGKGKTTLFRLIAGLEKAKSGTIEVEGGVSYMFQEDRLFENLTLLENLTLVCPDENLAEQLLTDLNLYAEKGTFARELSGGMKRRASLARALLYPAENVLLDEAFTGMDDNTKQLAINAIIKNCKGKTLIIASHDNVQNTFCNETLTL